MTNHNYKFDTLQVMQDKSLILSRVHAPFRSIKQLLSFLTIQTMPKLVLLYKILELFIHV